LAGLVHQDVGGLQIPVNDAALMSMIHGIADLRDEFQARSQVEMPLLGELDEGPPSMNSIAKYGCEPKPLSAVPAS
jgi:hypothetical protein